MRLKIEELEKMITGQDIVGAMSRLDTVENLVVAFRQEQDKRGGQELKDMMSNLKSKYKFLEPTEEKKSSAVLTQVTVLEEKFTQLNSLVSTLNQSIANIKNSNDALITDKIKAVNFRIL